MRLWNRRVWLLLAAAGGFASVGFGAFAAHGVADPHSRELLRTGALYGFIHALATFGCATLLQIGGRRARFAPAFFLGGVVLFSGSLYAMALGAPAWLGAITPLGGLAFLIGWAIMAWAALDVDRG